MREFSVESSVIGMLLLDSDTAQKVIGWLTADDFSQRMARLTFESILKRTENGESIEPPLIASDLKRVGFAEGEINSYFTGCMEISPSVSDVDEYIKALKNDTQARKLSEIADKINDSVLINDDWQNVANEAIRGIESLKTPESNTKTLGSMLNDWLSYCKDVRENPDSAYCKTYYSQIDYLLGGGMYNGGMYILAARPGMGKTTVALNLVNRIARRRPVLFVSLEMSKIQITAKILSICSGIGYSKLMTGQVSDEELQSAYKWCVNLGNQMLHVNDDSTLTVEQIGTEAKSIEGISCVIVDYLGLLPMPGDKTVRDGVTLVSKSLKALAKRLNVPILVLCQLNRDSTQRAGHRATMADLRDSGAIEQDADGVLLLHREGYYQDAEERPEREEIEIIIDKNRHGNTGTVKLLWNGITGRIEEFSPKYGGDCFV